MPNVIYSNFHQFAQAAFFGGRVICRIFPTAPLAVRRGLIRNREKGARRAAANAQLESSVRNTELALRDYTEDQGRGHTPIGAGGGT
jgi:hypothetical protein